MKHAIAAALGGIVLGCVLAPAITAARPLPPPTIQRVEIPTADRLDTGVACVYTWDGALYQWTRADLGISLQRPCPSRAEAQAKWNAARQAPTALIIVTP